MKLRRTSAFRLRLLVVAALAGLTTTTRANEFRALWVNSVYSGFKSATEVTQLINDARAGNFNAVVVEIRERGDAYYNDSPYEPKATDISPPSFDPLQDLINKGHDTSGGKARIEIHAWIVTYPISSTAAPPPNSPMALHPDWLCQDNTGATYDGQNYLFDPGHPGVQQYTFNVAMDILSRYDIDGLNLDYIRYSGKAWGYNPVAVQRFNTIYHHSGPPSTTDPAWLQFRRDQVTALLRKIYLSALALKPQVRISADTVAFAPGWTTDTEWTNHADAYVDKLQDWRGWMEEGILDLNLPMMYFDQPTYGYAWDNWSIFAKNHRFNRQVALGPGIWLNTIADSITQIRSSRANTASGYHADGVCCYDYHVTNDEGQSRATFLNALTHTSSFDTITPPVFDTAVATPAMTWKTAPSKGHLKGFVYDAANANGLDYATVALSGPVNKTLHTDATGFFGAVDLPPGAYTLTVSFAGYQGTSSNVAVSVGAVATQDFDLAQSAAPVIIQPPQSQSVVLGNDAVFSVTATGNPAPSYQWRFNDANISGATASAYTRTNVSGPDGGTYTVVVSNGFGSVTSAPAILTIVSSDDPPVLTLYPQDQTAIVGSTVTLTAFAQGTSPLNYQWRLNGINIANATGATLTLPNVQHTSAGDYTVSVANNAGSDVSLPASLTVNYALNLSLSGNGTVTKRPDWPSYPPNTVVTLTATTSQIFAGWSGSVNSTANPLTIIMNGNKSLTATFTNEVVVDDTAATVVGPWSVNSYPGYYGTGYHYRSGGGSGANYLQFTPNFPAGGSYEVYTWYVKGPTRSTSAPHVIHYNGGTQTVYVNQQVNGSQWVSLGTFNFLAGTSGYVRITDASLDSGQIMADAIRFVSTATPPMLPPTILSQPQPLTVVAGQDATFDVSATGPGNLSYLWLQDGSGIPGGSSNPYTRVNAQAAHAGNYSVRVANFAGSVFSSNALLTVNVPVSITTQPQTQTNNQGSDATFSVAATGTPPLYYQWRYNGLPIPDATGSAYVRPAVQPEDEGNFSVVVYNAAGGLASSNATLAVRLPPVIVSNPVDQTANPGGTVTFHVSATGTAPFAYRWQHSGADLPGATSDTCTLTNVQAADAGVYSVIVSNAAGVGVSDPAVLTITVPPSISQPPQSRTNDVGTDAAFSVTATGTEPLSFQWRFNGGDIPDATASTYTRAAVQTNDAGNYSVVITNVAGAITSAPALLAVLPPSNLPHIDSITLQPDGHVQLLISGGPGQFGIDVAPTLSNWTNLAILTNTESVFPYTDPETNQASRFYRVYRGPQAP